MSYRKEFRIEPETYVRLRNFDPRFAESPIGAKCAVILCADNPTSVEECEAVCISIFTALTRYIDNRKIRL